MKSRRISLSFGDTPEELFAVSVLNTKGRKKALYVARCIAACEKRRSFQTAGGTPEELVSIVRGIVEQTLPGTAGQNEADLPTRNPFFPYPHQNITIRQRNQQMHRLKQLQTGSSLRKAASGTISRIIPGQTATTPSYDKL